MWKKPRGRFPFEELGRFFEWMDARRKHVLSGRNAAAVGRKFCSAIRCGSPHRTCLLLPPLRCSIQSHVVTSDSSMHDGVLGPFRAPFFAFLFIYQHLSIWRITCIVVSQRREKDTVVYAQTIDVNMERNVAELRGRFSASCVANSNPDLLSSSKT